MKSKRRWSERTRLMLTLELAVVLPAAALVILSAVHLTEIQRDRGVEAAFQRDFNQVLAISEKEINQKAYDLPMTSEANSPALARLVWKRWIGFSRLILTLLTSSSTNRAGRLTFRSQPSRLKDASFRAEADDFSSMTSGWMQVGYKDEVKELEEMSKNGKPYSFFRQLGSARRKAIVSIRRCLFLVPDSQGGHKAIGGMAFDAEYLTRSLLSGNAGDTFKPPRRKRREKPRCDDGPSLARIHAIGGFGGVGWRRS